MDVGVASTPWSDRLWRIAQQILLVSSPSKTELRASYAAVKLATAGRDRPQLIDGQVRLVLADVSADGWANATAAATQFERTCQDYLGWKPANTHVLSADFQIEDRREDSYERSIRALAADLLSHHHATASRLPGTRQRSRNVAGLRPSTSLRGEKSGLGEKLT